MCICAKTYNLELFAVDIWGVASQRLQSMIFCQGVCVCVKFALDVFILSVFCTSKNVLGKKAKLIIFVVILT